jgi:DNA end-binding protein Ku
MASTVWKGYIAFGLVSIPIRLFAAVREERVGFHQIHAVCNSRIRQQLYCPTCDRVVERSEIKKGYEVSKDTYVLIDDEEVKKIAPPSSETMEIRQFVKLSDIDPMYFDASYYAVPEEAGKKAYQLLLRAMIDLNYVALAQITMHQREYAVSIRPQGKGLMLHTLFYANEVRQVPEYGSQSDAEVKERELEMAEKLIQALAQPFEPEKLEDHYQQKLLQLVEAKSAGQVVKGTPQKRLAPVADLMTALQQSLSGKPAGTATTSSSKPKQKPIPISHRKKAAG